MKSSVPAVLWLVFELAVSAVLPFALAVWHLSSDTYWVLGVACAWSVGWTWFFTRLSLKQFTLLWKNDCLVFAAFIRHFRSENPILANAVWKKVHPNIPPPWLVGEGKPDAEV